MARERRTLARTSDRPVVHANQLRDGRGLVYRGCVSIARVMTVVRAPHIATRSTPRVRAARCRLSLAIVVGVASISPAHAAPVRVPMQLVAPPPTFDASRFGTSLETYVTNAVVVVSPRAAAADDVVCADAIAQAHAASAPVALWARWVAPSDASPAPPMAPTMTVSMVTVEKGCAEIDSSTVDVPPDQPDFVYRVAALKIASLLRVLPESSVGQPTGIDPRLVPGDKNVPAVVTPAPVPARPRHTIEVGATGVASTTPAGRTLATSIGVWRGERFAFGGALFASMAHEATAAGGAGTARVFGVHGGVRLRAWARGRLAIIHEMDVGLASVWASADRSTGVEAMSETVWTPFVAIAPHLRIALAGPLHVTVGPTLDLAWRRVDLRVAEVPLYHAGVVRFRWDARVQLWF
jgi:hypothetical protein